MAALRAGAAAWVRKDESLQYLLQAIHGVALLGDLAATGADGAGAATAAVRAGAAGRSRSAAGQDLTQREREVLTWLADGAGRLEVAQRLHVSPHTVRAHLQHLMAKLGVHTTLEAVALTRSRLRAPADLGQDPGSAA